MKRKKEVNPTFYLRPRVVRSKKNKEQIQGTHWDVNGVVKKKKKLKRP
jgi:hypothetical protein